jgi:hypothetical protein
MSIAADAHPRVWRGRALNLTAGLGIVAVFGAFAGVGLWAHDRGRTGNPGAATAPTPTKGALAHFSRTGLGLSFSYPASWQSFDSLPAVQSGINGPPYLAPVGDGAIFSTPIIAFSSQGLRVAQCSPAFCPPSLQPDGQLQPNGILVVWSADGLVGGRSAIDSVPGEPTTIAGQPAKIDTQLVAGCAAVGGDGSITAFIDRGTLFGNLYRMSACFRGPDTATFGSEVRAMLASGSYESSGPGTVG